MAAGGSGRDFKLVFPDRVVGCHDGDDVTLLCHLSPEISAVAMEIRWFRGTDCVCLSKYGHVIEGRGYEGRVSVDPLELRRGDVSLTLTGFRWGDDGVYTCQVISGGHMEEGRVRLETSLRGLFGTNRTNPAVRGGVLVDKRFTADERKKMEKSVRSLALTLTQRREKEQLAEREQLEQYRHLEERNSVSDDGMEHLEERNSVSDDGMMQLEEINRNHQPGQLFIDTHHTALIERVNMVNPVMDRLLQWKVISGEDYDLIRSRSPRQEQMRSLLNHGNIRASQRGKDLLYKALVETDPFMMEELNNCRR